MRLSLYVLGVCFIAGCASVVDTDWQAAKQTDTLKAYYHFRSTYSYARDGSQAARYVDEATRRICELEWDVAMKANSIEAYTEFLRSCLQSTKAGEAKERLEELEWAKAQSEGSTLSYSLFASEFPTGRHAAEARTQADKLDWETASSEDSIASYRAYLRDWDNGLRPGAFVSQARSRLPELLNTVTPLSPDQVAGLRRKINELLAPYNLVEIYLSCPDTRGVDIVHLAHQEKSHEIDGETWTTRVLTTCTDEGSSISVTHSKGPAGSAYDFLYGKSEREYKWVLKLAGLLDPEHFWTGGAVGFEIVQIAGEHGKVSEQYELIEDKWYRTDKYGR